MEEIAKALELKNELDNMRPIDKEKEAIIMQKFRLDWNYHSNHLEGNSLTYGETKALILFGITAQGKPLKDTLEITGHNEAINWVIDLVKGERPLTENFIRELHSLLLKDSYKESKNAEGVIVPRKISAGKYKTTTNHVETVTGEIFYFATPEETPAKMHDLLNWYSEKTKEEQVNPILVSAEFHYRFIRIHPFDDGNGRTARILMNFILMQFGFPPVIIKTEDKANYFAALQLADAGNIEAFVEYIAQNLVSSLEIMIAGAKGESIEEDDDLDKEIALLEQRLSGFGEKIEKVKSLENINYIFSNSIKKLAFEIQSKLSKFEKHYLKHSIDVIIGTESTNIYKSVFSLDSPVNLITINVNYSTLKIKGFEEFEFIFQIKFEFKELFYSVHEINSASSYFQSNYENLSDLEISKILKELVNRHNNKINYILNKESSNKNS
ncbi:MAG: Fic family protein [Flavobacterium sp.]